MSEDDEISSPEDEDFDETKHASLLKNMSKMDGKMKAGTQRREVSSMSEHFASSSRDKVKLHQLVGALQQQTGHRELKKQIQRVKEKDKVLPVPLCKPEQERMHRALAYDKVSKDVSKWNSIVQKNRRAEQLMFPLEQPDLRVLTSAEDLVKRSQPRTSLEVEVAALLGNSETVIDSSTALTPAEYKAMQAMSIEEARERRAELQKYRALLSYEEAKARRQKKIKSKKFHRILQKEKLKKEKKSLEEMEKSDPDAYMEKLRQLDADRMQERISLKHRGGSKFAKKQAIYKKYDDKSRDAIQEMLRKSRELSKKVAVETDSSEGEESDTAVPLVDKPVTSSSNPWMTAGIRVSKQNKTRSYSKPEAVQNMNEVESEKSDEDDSIVVNSTTQADVIENNKTAKEPENVNIDKLFDKLEQKNIKTVRQMKHQKYVTDVDEDDTEEDEEEELRLVDDLVSTNTANTTIKMSLKRKKTMEDFDEDQDDEESEGSEVEEAIKDRTDSKSMASDRTAGAAGLKEASLSDDKALSVDPSKFTTLGGRKHGVLLAEEEGSDQEEGVESQGLTIAQAFATDDVVGEFSSEKRGVEERDRPKDVSMVLPGWGDWGGEGVQVSKRKKKRFTLKGAPPAPRRDRNLDTVIISEVKDRTIAKHQVSAIPFPFSNSDQFESSIRQPIGKTWNPETAYKKLIKPKKVTRMGTIITPMDKSQLFTKGKEEGLEKKKKNKKKNSK